MKELTTEQIRLVLSLVEERLEKTNDPTMQRELSKCKAKLEMHLISINEL